MKKNSLSILALFVLIFNILAQPKNNYKVIETALGEKLSSKHYEIGEQVEAIYRKLYDENVPISPKDRKFLDSVESKYSLSDIEDGYYPWNVYSIGCSWYCGSSYETSVSSSLLSTSTNSYGAEQIGDDDTRTAWVEGVKGYGVGESISFTFGYYAARATNVDIVNGYAKNETTWKNNSRVKKFFIYDEDELIGEVNLKDYMGWQHFVLPSDFPNLSDEERRDYREEFQDKKFTLKFVIGEVYKGDKYDDTAISAITFSGKDVHCLAKGTQITMADNESKNIEDIKVGDKVLAMTNEKEQCFATVQKLHTATHKLMTLTLKNGMKITLTANHPLATSSSKAVVDIVRYTNTDKRYDVGTDLIIYDKGKFEMSPIAKIRKASNEEYQVYTLELDDEGALFIANGVVSGQE